jgi:hypothetical protein
VAHYEAQTTDGHTARFSARGLNEIVGDVELFTSSEINITHAFERAWREAYPERTNVLYATSAPPLTTIVHELRDALRAQRDHLDDMLSIFCRLETALLQLATVATSERFSYGGSDWPRPYEEPIGRSAACIRC